MHDPKVVAFEIKRPWPSKYRGYQGKRYWPALFTVWHNEPDGRDALTVCKYTGKWQWHFWHWSIQWHFEQKLRRWLFERCIECKRRYPWNYAPVSHQWDAKKSRWFKVAPHAYHHECSSLVIARNVMKGDEQLIHDLVSEIGIHTNESVQETVKRLTDPRGREWPFSVSYRLQKVMETWSDEEGR